MRSIFSGLITSKTRIKILMRLFLNPRQNAYLRELAHEFNASPSQVRDELRQLKDAGFLESHKNGRQIQYKANQKHPLFNELQSKLHQVDMIAKTKSAETQVAQKKLQKIVIVSFCSYYLSPSFYIL